MLTKKPWRLGTRAKLLLRGLRYSCILPYASIDGWLTVDEAITLFELARDLPGEAPRAVEIGCWQGKSTVCIANGLRGKPGAQLTCIDPFDASGDAESHDAYEGRAAGVGGPLRQAFEHNLEDAGVRDLIDVRQGFSHDLTDAVDASIDLLFLDGDHSYEAILRDFEDWAPKLKPGGVLAMHDVVHPVHEGPSKVVQQRIANDPQWLDQRYVDSMFVARRAGG
ncbi:MAG: class I SAM-dependent methyltransferase [Planctomycetes bacterium]|nr:class I SAM-dependent methyltransferase [Planctomycetota bacterium]